MTIKQKQHLLAFLGFYTGIADGIWGQQSRRATEAFQTAYMENTDGLFGPGTEKRIREVIASGEEPAVKNEDFWQNIQYFAREEFRCTCGGRGSAAGIGAQVKDDAAHPRGL